MKRLYRSAADRKIAGVCGGLGEYLDLDPTILRLAWALVCIITGIVPLVVVYLLAWILVPRA
jgi:phage shock protein C